MKCKNLKDIREMLMRLGKHVPESTHQMTLIASFAAADLWMNKTPENSDTEELRRQLISLDATGFWAIVAED